MTKAEETVSAANGVLTRKQMRALVEMGAQVVGARVARRELDLEDESAQLLEVDVRVRVHPLRPRVVLLHRRPPLPPPAHLSHLWARGADFSRRSVGNVLSYVQRGGRPGADGRSGLETKGALNQS
jgi:hypothetical protein